MPLPTNRHPWKPSSSGEVEAPPTNNLWIGNLSPEVSEADLTDLFSKFGPIDSMTNYSARTYAFIYYKNMEDAKAAKEKIQGTVLRGNPIKIEFAKPAKPCKSLWVAGISQSVSMEELQEEFKKFGKIQEFKFLRDRNTAYVDYFRLEDASQALKSMNGKRIGGDPIRVDYLRSQPSRREHGPDYRDSRDGQFPGRSIFPPDAHWTPEESIKAYPEPIFDGYKRHQFMSPAGLRGEGQPSKVLWIRYPPSVRVDEDMLHNAMILFGEIESIKMFEDRSYAFVQFRSVDEARLAKQGLQGKLFSDPRISIEYSNNELAPPNEYYGSYAELKGPRPDMSLSEVPLGQGQMDFFGHERQNFAPRGIIRPEAVLRPFGPQGGFEPGYAGTGFDDLALVNKLQDGNRHAPLGGPNWRRSSPVPGMVSSPSTGLRPQSILTSGSWDTFDASQLPRESKRLRVDERFGLDAPLVNYEGRNRHSPINRTLVSGHGQRRAGNDHVWRGVIAKGGSPICRARCVPIEGGVGFEIPDVVNCTARTGLDMLTKHYADAVGFSIVFFLPDSEADFAPYTEFLRYLGSRNRAGVAKFEDTTLFLVPPSDFLTSVLNVAGPERLYGVVLEFPQAAPTGAPNQPQYDGVRPTAYNGMPQDESSLRINSNTISRDNLTPPLKTAAPPNPVLPVNTAPVPQSGLALTPELIATLASLLPSSNKSSGAEHTLPLSAMVPSTNMTTSQDQGIAQGWINERLVSERSPHPAHQLSSQFPGQVPFGQQDLAYQPVSSAPSISSQMSGGYFQVQDQMFNAQQQAVVSSSVAIPATSLNGQAMVPPYHNQPPDGSTHATDAMRFLASSILQQPSIVRDTNSGNVQHLHEHVSSATDADMGNHVAQLNSTMRGVGPVVSETEDEKNRRYQTTLLFAANLLSKVQQPQEKRAGQS